MKKHHKNCLLRQRWQCIKCQTSFCHKGALLIHARSHDNRWPYACQYCNRRFLLLSSLQCHLRGHPDALKSGPSRCIHHNKGGARMFPSCKDIMHKCSLCYRIFPKRESADFHLRQFHRIYREEVREKILKLASYPKVHEFPEAPAVETLLRNIPEAPAVETRVELPRNIPVASQLRKNEDSHESSLQLGGVVSLSANSIKIEREIDPQQREITFIDDASSKDSPEITKGNGSDNSVQSLCSDSGEISEDEWEKLNQAFAKSKTIFSNSERKDKEERIFEKDLSESNEMSKNFVENITQNLDFSKWHFDSKSHCLKRSAKQLEEMESNMKMVTKNFEEQTKMLSAPSVSKSTCPKRRTCTNHSLRCKGRRKTEGKCEPPQFYNVPVARHARRNDTLERLAVRSDTLERLAGRKDTLERFAGRSDTLERLAGRNDTLERPCHKCGVCSATFADGQGLKDHMSRHEGTKTHYLKCSQCPKVFSSKYTLSHHERIHSEYRPFQCKVCGKGFYQRANIKVHMRRHTGERPFKCNICGKAYSVKISLAAHSGVHREQNKFACQKCKFCFSSAEDLRKHQSVHAIQREHVCPRCGKVFLKAYLLEFHLQRGCEDQKFICEHCNKSFACLDYLKVHQRVHTGEKPFGCEFCGKFFSQSANLSKHLRIHQNIRPFACDLCDSTFIEKASMIAHRRIHTGEKPNMCDVCGTAFSSQSSLVIHMRRHTGERPYSCDRCDKQFASSSRLRDHVRTHTGEKPYKCKLCDRSFALSNGLARHTRIHTGQRPHKCEYCGERFMRKDRLRKHVVTTHAESQASVAVEIVQNFLETR